MDQKGILQFYAHLQVDCTALKLVIESKNRCLTS